MEMITDFKVGYSYSVDVTHVNNPHSFYVRPANASDYIDAIEKPGLPISNRQVIPVGKRVIFKSNIHRKYVRGEIHYIKKEAQNLVCDVFAIDYGCLEKSILASDMHALDPNAGPKNQCPGLAVHCRLYLCEPRVGDVFTENVIDMMKHFIGDNEHTANIEVMSKLNDQLVVELRTTKSPRDISMMLGLFDLTTFTKGVNIANRSCDPSALNFTKILIYKHRDFKIGDVLHVRVQSGTSLSGGFYVAEINEYKKLIYGQPAFSMYCKDQREMLDQDIVPGRACAVRIGSPAKYERAVIKKILEPNSKAEVQLVDWGKDTEIPFSCIKPVKTEMYFTQPIIAIYCSTHEEQAWSNGLPKFLFPGYEFVIKIMDLGSGFGKPHRVNIYPYKM